MKISVIIPAYNEKNTIKKIIDKIKRVDIPKEIIVVDDGSTNGTSKILKNIRDIKLIIHEKNKGKGYAIRSGIKHAIGEIIIIQDADLEYNPSEFSQLIDPIVKGETKIVYGSRMLSQNQRRKNIMFVKNSFKRQYILAYLGGRLLTFLTNALYGTHITDEATCYKVFNAEILKNLPLKCNRFEFCPEVTAKLSKRGYRIKEVPISYEPRRYEEGKKINWKDGLHAIWILFKYRFTD